MFLYFIKWKIIHENFNDSLLIIKFTRFVILYEFNCWFLVCCWFNFCFYAFLQEAMFVTYDDGFPVWWIHRDDLRDTIDELYFLKFHLETQSVQLESMAESLRCVQPAMITGMKGNKHLCEEKMKLNDQIKASPRRWSHPSSRRTSVTWSTTMKRFAERTPSNKSSSNGNMNPTTITSNL